MLSRLYVGQVRHRRFSPRSHSFTYRLFMLYLDLDELPGLFDRFIFWSARKFNLAWFKRADHLGDSQQTLSNAVRKQVFAQTGRLPSGPIRLLTHLRYFGYGFNPVSFYYCFNANDDAIEFVVAEVNNTPWGEQQVYVYPVEQNKPSRCALVFRSDKEFHVSPFMPMDMTYVWRITPPGEALVVHIENHRNQKKVFDATLTMKVKPLDSFNLATVLLLYPLMTVKVVVLIYYEAVRLWLKKIPIYSHPKSQEALVKGKEP